ncbi:hypothetical protein [Hymenobacter sp. BT491]|uniref:hypothetical protein n=1 Tax=Hymenobacter sp. BT491 TaxID=2766779 RepID=UPI001653A25C|nr:hypothetical protein [Hymenobacter sp. BT491]MBC6988410.1 hypothetical protein [Hymenobacter sp. BT491]
MAFSTSLRLFRRASYALLMVAGTACASIHERAYAVQEQPEESHQPENQLELLRFRLVPDASGQRVQWVTPDELACSYFVVERRTEQGAFQALGRVPGDAMAVSARSHEFVDTTPVQGRAQYRLRQVDLDGLVHTGPVLETMPSSTIFAAR